MGTVTMTFIGQSENVHILAGIFSLDNLYSTRKTPLLVRVNCGDILPETNNQEQCMLGDLDGNFQLTWLSIESPYMS